MPRLKRFHLCRFTNTLTGARATLLFQNPHKLFSSTKQEQPKRNHLLSLLHKNPTRDQVARQVHSLLLTTGLLNHSLLLFNSLLRCYSLSHSPHQSFSLYKQFQQVYKFDSSALSNPSFDSFTYAFLINASTNFCCQTIAGQFHGLVFRVGFQDHVYVQTALVKMYISSGGLRAARAVFVEMPERNLVTWNVMLTGLVKMGELELARSLFDEMPEKNVVSWTGIIDGYVRANRFTEGLDLFRRMDLCDGIKPSEITILAILPAASNIGDLKFCSLIHGYGEKGGFNAGDIRVANSIIDTYAKCGCIASAWMFFEEIPDNRKNLVSWTSLISGLAMHGMGKEAKENFQRMEKAGIQPNRVTFLSVLNACSHGGLADEGLKFFDKMVNEYQIFPDMKHYGCIVDVLGRAGRLEEAEKLALSIPGETADVVMWRALVGACSFYGNVQMAQRVTRKIMEIEGGYGGDYVLMYNIFNGVGRFQDAENFRRVMDERNAFKAAGHSLVQLTSNNGSV